MSDVFSITQATFTNTQFRPGESGSGSIFKLTWMGKWAHDYQAGKQGVSHCGTMAPSSLVLSDWMAKWGDDSDLVKLFYFHNWGGGCLRNAFKRREHLICTRQQLADTHRLPTRAYGTSNHIYINQSALSGWCSQYYATPFTLPGCGSKGETTTLYSQEKVYDQVKDIESYWQKQDLNDKCCATWTFTTIELLL